ncbi:MAG: hypothetical protein HY914_06080 [Desulfomonile tiedjei]|nr:hypothetical protein [Desulfomonile tiedjei]
MSVSIIEEIRDEIRSVLVEPKGRDLTILALVFLILPGLYGSYQLFWKGSSTGYIWIGVGVALAVSRLIPPLFRQIYKVWIAFSVILGYFVSRILLTLIFFLVVTPVGLVMRLTGRDPMDRKWDPAAPTYWKAKEQEQDPTVERYERQF